MPRANHSSYHSGDTQHRARCGNTQVQRLVVERRRDVGPIFELRGKCGGGSVDATMWGVRLRTGHQIPERECYATT